jgi:SUKH-3 immunity protein/YwqJ-like deaminase
VSHTESVLPSGITVQRFTDPQPLPAAFGKPLPDHILDRIGLHWAERKQVPPTHVIMREEELGYAIWVPGRRDEYATFIDKVTGRQVGFTIPDRMDKQYATKLEHEDGLLPRPGFGGPAVEAPSVVAEVGVAEGSTHHPRSRAVSARTGPPPVLHPLVQARLSAIPPAARVRGAERHAELIALGGAVETADAARAAAGRPLLTPDELDGPQVSTSAGLHRIRDPGDPRAGGIGGPCATCARVLGRTVREQPLTWRRRVAARARLHRGPAVPPGDVVDRVVAIAGVHGRHRPSAAAVIAVTRYFGKRWSVEEPGRVVRTARFAIDPLAVADSADTLARVAGKVGVPLFPLGSAGLEGILAIAPDGRVVLTDDSGEWLIGTDIRRALDTLILGEDADRLP